MSRVAGIIFSDSYDVAVGELTRARTLAAVPFAGRYRVIDFTVSNMVNAGIDNIGVITTRNYTNLMEHVRGGKVWDLDTKRASLTFLSPFGSDNTKGMYESRLEALQTHRDFIANLDEDYVIIYSCNYIGNIDLEELVEAHRATGARITALYTKTPLFKSDGPLVNKYFLAENGALEQVEVSHMLHEGDALGVNCFVMEKNDLIDILDETARKGETSFRRHILMPMAEAGEAYGYETKSTLLFIDDCSAYLKSSLSLLDHDIRYELFEQKGSPIITRAQDSAPGKYGANAVVENCLIADGVRIEGTVRNSIIFRDVIVKKGAVVENSVIMQDAIVGENANLSYAILDNNVIINDGRSLGGYITHPFYLDQGTVI